MQLVVLSKSIIINQMLFLFVILTFTIPVITLQILSIPIFVVIRRQVLKETIQPHQMRDIPLAPAMTPMSMPEP